MTLSIVTINYNNAPGLRKTLDSVLSQTSHDFEHIIIDGASTDTSVDIIKSYTHKSPHQVIWLSEPDSGIYNAMNKGIRKATSDYIMILNSGDCLARSTEVITKLLEGLKTYNYPSILYGNLTKVWNNGRILKRKNHNQGYTPMSFLTFYTGTLDPDGTLIKRSLFDKYGLFNENLKICSDWEWFIKSIALGGEKAYHIDTETVLFDMGGISESNGKNRHIIESERRTYLESILPASVLKDYDTYHQHISTYTRLKRHHLWGLVYFIERVIFKFEKWGILK